MWGKINLTKMTFEQIAEFSNAPDDEFNKKMTDYVWDQTGLVADNCNEMLTIFRRVVDSFDVKYWLTYGTALGFYRDGDFIPWDDDIDTHVDGHRMIEVGVEEIRQRFIHEGVVARAKERGLNSKMSLFYLGVKLQLQGVYEEGGMMHAKLFQYPADFYNNAELFEYRGVKYPLPGPRDDYLTFCYDQDWAVPKKLSDWRDYMNPKQFKSPKWLAAQQAHRVAAIKK